MSAFACALSLDRAPRPGDAARLLRRVAPVDAAMDDGPFSAAAAVPVLRPLAARRGTLAAVGDARLDNRAELRRHAAPVADGASDLEVVLALF
ncbi:hypothetical protein, partial [Longimicrobium sp.]|uniref:hypothetical protein n=1 Tax=Longimicrobium sp. TaxID=2029185 RepID=UPI002E2F8947